MAEDDWEGAFGVFAGEGVGIWMLVLAGVGICCSCDGLTGMANAGVVDLYPNFMVLWSFDLDIFDGKVFASFPCNGRLGRLSAVGFSCSFSWSLTLHVIVCWSS